MDEPTQSLLISVRLAGTSNPFKESISKPLISQEATQ